MLPGRKQVFRQEADGTAIGDIIAGADEEFPGRPLLEPVMRKGRRTADKHVALDEARNRARREIARLSSSVRALAPTREPYPVSVSDALKADQERLAHRLAG